MVMVSQATNAMYFETFYQMLCWKPDMSVLSPGLAVWHVGLWPECHPNQTRLRLEHRGPPSHGVSLGPSLVCEGWKHRVGTVVWQGPGGLRAKHSGFQRQTAETWCDYAFIGLGNSIKHKNQGNSRSVALWETSLKCIFIRIFMCVWKVPPQSSYQEIISKFAFLILTIFPHICLSFWASLVAQW